MKKITFLFVLLLVFGYSAQAQYSFPSIAGPTNVASGTPVTLNINDVANVASAPASSTGSYSSFEVTADWAAGGGNPWSNEADLTLNTTGGNSVVIDPATSGAGANGNATQLVFTGDFVTPYDPSTDGFIDIVLNQSFGGSNADWSNIVVTIFESPTCLEPSGMDTANNIGTAVDLNWTANSGETAWNIQWNADADFTPGNGEETGATSASGTPTTNISGLVLDTNYFVYYQADCGGGDTSAWVGPFTFRTGYCESVPSSNDGDGITQIIAGSTTLTSAGDVTYEDFTGTTVNLSQSILATVLIDFATGFTYNTNIWIDFNNDFDFDDAGELVFQGESTNANPTTLDASFVMPSVPLGTYRMRIGTADSGQATPNPCYNGSWGVTADLTINVTDPPACIPPTFLQAQNITDTSAQIDWTANNGELNWEIVVQPAGTGVPTGAGTATTDNPYSAMALNPSSAYEVYVRADCGTGFSDWAGPLNFTTDNTPPPPPNGVTCSSGASSFLFVEDFETDPAAGWTGTTFSGNNGDWQITAGDGNSGGTGPFASFNGGMHLEYEASGNSSDIASAITPAIDLAAAVDGAELSFYMHAFGEDMGTLNVGIATDPAGPFTNLYTWIGNYQAADTDDWVPIGINLDAYLGQVVYIEFSYGGAGSGFEGDMSIDFVRVESCGNFCIAPNPVNITNVQGASADLDWVANNGESAWEYVVQPAGTGEPTGAGTATTTNSVNLTGLNFETDYEVYVRADCGNGYSVWAGPVNFTTTIQVNYTVDCAAGPVNVSYCYTNNESTFWVFTSSDGVTPLRLTFNSGNIEGFYDDISVYDGPDNTSPLLYNNNDANNNDFGAYDLTGTQINSTGPVMFVEVASDGSVSCDSSATYTPWDFSVICATCTNPEANYLIVDDCDNGDQFLVDVDITSMGDATTLNITDNQGSTPVAVTTTGVTQFGPYPFGVDIIITIENADDSNCIINSPALLQLACPPANDECFTAIEVTPNADDTCTNFASGTILGATESAVPNGCNGTADDDVWYSFNAVATDHAVTLNNVIGGGLSYGIYEGTDCNALTELYCSPAFGNQTVIANGLTVGNTYYVRIYSTTADPFQDITFDLCIFTVPPPIYTSDTDYTVEEIITDILANENPDCPQISNITYSTGTNFGSTSGIGYFEANGSNWPFEAGLIMTTGDINNAPGPEDETLSDGGGAWPGDADLEAAINTDLDNTAGDDLGPGESTNASFIEFDFVPIVDHMSFDFIFAAEEYGTFQCGFSDAFAFLLTDSSGNTTNLAVVPGTTQPVSVFTVRDNTFNNSCTSENPEYFGNFYGDNGVDPILAPIDFRGHTTILTAQATVVPNEVYHIKLVIADDGGAGGTDTLYDSAVFIGAGTFNIGRPDLGDDITLGSGQETCEGNPLTLDAGDPPANADIAWYMDGVLLDGETSSTLVVTETAFYRVEYSYSNLSCAVSDEVLVEFYENPEPEPIQATIVRCEDLEVTLEVVVNNSEVLETMTYYWTYGSVDIQSGPDNTLVIPAGDTNYGEYLVTAIDERGCFGSTTITVIEGTYPVLEPLEAVVDKCVNEDAVLEVSATNSDLLSDDLVYTWYIDGAIVQSSSDNTYVHLSGEPETTIDVVITDQVSQCTGETSIEVVYYQNENCVDVPQGLSPDGDGKNDCLILDHLEDKEDIIKAEVFNRYGTKVYELNEYVDQWCGTNQDGDLLPVGTYFYIIRFKSSREPITSWIYLNY